MDFVHQKVDSSSLSKPIDLEPQSDENSEQSAIEAVCAALSATKRPAILVDCLVSRFGATRAVQDITNHLKFPTFSTSMGKSIVDEKTNAFFYGTYNGKVCPHWMHNYIENESDLVLEFGSLLSDSNTGGHSREIASQKLISVHPNMVVCFGKSYESVSMKSFLEKLHKRLLKTSFIEPASLVVPPSQEKETSDQITQDYIWHRLAAFLRPDDVLIAESGTAQFGFPDTTLPQNTTYITQVYYGSIGYSVGACLGAAIAKREEQSEGRVVLVVGDGSLQLTVQEVGTMIRLGLKNIIIIVINNRGYTIERAIHGPEKAYNDITPYNHQLMLLFFNHPSGRESSREARSRSELETILNSPGFADAEALQLSGKM
ncbi:hypothetical protein H2198_000980 [Neophaeococcomyces mojaviensis]|uniref:Uncharacterized protein n=1 Tax=Neophaeococcomyces mojaviensis TaxID=3383035 RepID=A0ACC3AJC4_9EURO|nr:hypothetical protein H2198_000980 [Knufia sp. JES_112]